MWEFPCVFCAVRPMAVGGRLRRSQTLLNFATALLSPCAS